MRRRRTFDPEKAYTTPPTANNPDRACKDSDVNFFPQHPSGLARAVAVCHACPVEDECLAWALETEQVFGVLGGKTPDERHDMIENKRGKAA